MKAITEFSVFTLNKANLAKAALVAEGKTPDEIKESLGTSFKIEGEKLGYFIQSLEIATANTQNLKRVLVVKLNEGEATPAKGIKAEDVCFVPDFLVLTPASSASAGNSKGGKGGRPGGRGKGAGGPKGSPWGISPEEKAAKNKKPVAP
jgi:hypothetical protein